MWSLLALAALALSPDVLTARLAEVEPLRAGRLASDAPGIPADAYAAALEGEIPTGLEAVPGHSARKAWGVAVVDVPIARYWAAINDDSSKVEHTPLEHLKILDGTACAPERTVFQYLPVSWVSDRWWIARITVNAALVDGSGGRVREMRWESVDRDLSTDPEVAGWAAGGIQAEFTKGAWLLVDLDGARTLVEYYAWTDPGGRVPAGLASRFAAGNISETLRAMEKLAAAGPGCPF